MLETNIELISAGRRPIRTTDKLHKLHTQDPNFTKFHKKYILLYFLDSLSILNYLEPNLDLAILK